ncbi:MAG: hypothetical protein KAU28_10350, partial [Phycisphaerae bacterium]|nr:hypothetical protein [Phycisphaerae bacterium]
MKASRLIRFLALCTLLAVATAASAEKLTLAGSDEALFLLRTDRAGSFDLLARPAGCKWTTLAKELPGSPTALAAVGKRAYV